MSNLDTFRQETREWLDENCPAEMRKPMTADGACWGGRNFKFSLKTKLVKIKQIINSIAQLLHSPLENGI